MIEPVDAAFEADIQALKAKISASSLNRAQDVKEPYDIPSRMMPVAYAMLETLCNSAIGSGREEQWFGFLQDALTECIGRANERF